jgi:NAD(P)-dependent dehydrogenase (short-subunit alcohol dehydrogenase family)
MPNSSRSGWPPNRPRSCLTTAHGARTTASSTPPQHGRLDILVNNAGIAIDKLALDITGEDWSKVVAVNLSGAFHMSQAALVHMLDRGTGRIVNVSSIVGETGNIGQANYAAAKSGLLGLTRALAKEAAFLLAKAGKVSEETIGLTVNAVTPGLIATEMIDHVSRKVLDGIVAQIPFRRLGRPRRGGPGGALPRRRRVVLHQRPDPGRQRRHGHMTCALPLPDGDQLRRSQPRAVCDRSHCRGATARAHPRDLATAHPGHP